MKNLFRLLSIVLSLFFFTAGSVAQVDYFLKFEDAGLERTTKNGKPMIEIYGFSHEVIAPRDAASGVATGKRQHKPLTITKEIDASSPLLFNLKKTGRVLPEVFVIAVNRNTGDKMKIKLAGVNFLSFTKYTDDMVEKFALNYEQIIVTVKPRGKRPIQIGPEKFFDVFTEFGL